MSSALYLFWLSFLSPPSSSNDHIIAEYRGELMFQLRDEERLKFLIRETLEERLPDSPDQKLDDCPHYKNGEMVWIISGA